MVRRDDTVGSAERAQAMELRLNVWLETDGEVALSPWRVALLEAVRETGSISRAAERQGVHFRVAWRKIREMEARLDTRLVLGHAGGAGGGGASLTPEAEQLMDRFRAFSSALEAHLRGCFREHFPELPLAAALIAD